MNRKVLGIFACLLLFATTFSVIAAKDNEITVAHNTLNRIGDTPFFEIQEDVMNMNLKHPINAFTLQMDLLDQESTQTDKAKKTGASDEELAQSFKPTYPILTRVILRLKSLGSAEYYYYYVDIKNSLLGSALTTAHISRDILVVGTGWYEFDFPDISVTPGDTYYIVLRGVSTSSDSSSVYWWYGYPNPYADGAAWYESISGWNYLQEGVQYCDYCFQTYGAEAGNKPPNTPSQLSGPSSGNTGQALTYTSSTTDPDGDTLTYTATNIPEGATFVGSTFFWTPNFEQAGSYPGVHFEVSDGTDIDFEDITITVKLRQTNLAD